VFVVLEMRVIVELEDAMRKSDMFRAIRDREQPVPATQFSLSNGTLGRLGEINVPFRLICLISYPAG